jgi:glycosyltransferase involved in cell wall biosynthesis
VQEGNTSRRIAVDRRGIGWREGTGVARYRDTVSAALARLGATVSPIGDGGEGAAVPAWRDLPRTLSSCLRAARSGDGWQVADLYRLAQRHFSLTGSLLEVVVPDPPALVHWSHPLPIRLVGAANLYTVHDLIPLETPDLTGISATRHARLLARIVAAAAHIVTVSETVRAEVIERCGIGEDRVTCCYQAVEPGTPGTLPAGLEQGGYFLVLGRVEARKNIERLILAHRMAATDVPLVIAGPDGHWRSAAEARRVRALLEQPQVMRLAWQSPQSVAALLAGARALLMPSLTEGFGLPAIEAMRAGVPAMVSKIGAAAEIAGDAALTVDPHHVAEIAAGIARLDRDQMLRDRLIARGRARAATFDIESFAARLSRLYERFD